MSKEGGRKAARYILDKHPELFEKNLIEAQPPIKAFMPKSNISEKSASTELLQTYIEGFDVSGSTEVYEILKKKGIDVDLATKQKLLELVIPFYFTDVHSNLNVMFSWIEFAFLLFCCLFVHLGTSINV